MNKSLSYIYFGLCLHFLVIGPLLFYLFLKLYRKDRFHWLSAGFWAWGSMALYYVAVPLVQYLSDPYFLETRLAVTEGLSRMVWVTICVALGISVFFLAYFKTRPARPRFGLPSDSWPPGTWAVLILMLAAAAYALITYRGAYGFTAERVLIVDGKYVGKVMGYEVVLYMLASFPIILLILRRSTRILGYGLLVLYLGARLGDAWDRTSAISLLLSVTMIAAGLRGRKWPPRFWIVLLLAFTLLMQVRGHASFSQFQKSGGLARGNLTEGVKRGEDTSVLATLYLSTYLYDKTGYSYGVPLVSGILFGPLPRKYFPWKDWLVNQFRPDFRKIRNPKVLEMMLGGKDTVIGDLYSYGNLFAILLGMPILGFLTRKLDGWVVPETPVAVRALGYAWLGYYYMLYASALPWGAACLYINIIPFLGVVLCAKLFGCGKQLSGQPTPRPFAPDRPLN
jgi:hypothetical protein